RFIVPVVLIIGLNYKTLVQLSQTHNPNQYIIALSALFLVITFTEFFFMLYEQFYIIEEAANKLFFFKILELSILYGLLTSPLLTSPFSTLSWILVIRCISFTIIAINGWFTWKIFPRLKTGVWYILICMAVAMAIR